MSCWWQRENRPWSTNVHLNWRENIIMFLWVFFFVIKRFTALSRSVFYKLSRFPDIMNSLLQVTALWAGGKAHDQASSRWRQRRPFHLQSFSRLIPAGPRFFELLPLSTMMRGISFSAGEEHLIRFPSTRPFISARSSKVQLTPAESSGTLWASSTNCKRWKRRKESVSGIMFNCRGSSL